MSSDDLVGGAGASQSSPDPFARDLLREVIGSARAALLERAGITSMHELEQCIESSCVGGPAWWKDIQGLGEIKARAIESDLRKYNDNRPPDWLAPIERVQLPAHLDGRDGRFRAPRQACLLDADNDLQAVQAWLANHKLKAHTWRAYRKEAERFLLWASFRRDKPLSSISHEDALSYRDFLLDPQPAAQWCGPRNARRWSARWRPFEGPLSHSAIKQALVTLHALYAFLVNMSYLVGNPFAAIVAPSTGSAQLRFQRRALSQAEMQLVRGAIDMESKKGRRLCALLDLLYATGLRLSAVAAARWGHLERVEQESGVFDWWLHTVGKRDKEHLVPVPEDVLVQLEVHGLDRGLPPLSRAGWEGASLIGRVTDPGGDVEAAPADAQACLRVDYLAQTLKQHFLRCAKTAREAGKEDVARKLERASTHWMRHTHATHVLKAGTPIEVVQAGLGHASVATTGLYLTTENGERAAAMRAFWNKQKGGS